MKRIRRLLYPKAPAGIWAPVAATVVLAATAAVSLAAWQPRTKQPAAARAQATTATRTFYLVNSETVAEMDNIVTALREVLDSQNVEAVYARKAIVVRDSPEKLSLASKIVDVEEAQAGSSANSDQEAALRLQIKTLQNLVRQHRLSEAQKLRDAIVKGNSNAAQGAQNDTRLTDPYSKWLDEDVPYIITPAERSDFLQLRTDQQRDNFITQFWERRNPTPGAADNAYRDEHYRRIAYANEHFAGPSGTPGWKTDRGRVYITWGPPDQRDEHSAGELSNRPMDQGGGTATTYAYEDWRYRNITGVNGEHRANVEFEFVDPAGTGEFDLTMNPGEKYAEAETAAHTSFEPQPSAAPSTTYVAQGTVQFVPASPYTKWLNEDVVYIITDEERDTFLHLQTDEERQQFITAFWERRNPTPGSADNKFKDEHYRRIAYANQHFGTPSGKAGWQTDRGHIYIVYGPPDRREEFLPGENGSQFATEIWRYNHINGVGDDLSFEFVSRGDHGDFTLAPAPSNAQAAPQSGGRSATAAPDQLAKEGVEILSSTEGIDFHPYIQAMLKSVLSRWLSTMPRAAEQGQKGQVSVTFDIQPDGHLGESRVSLGSGVSSLDGAALDAVRSSSPLKPLPNEFHGPYLRLKLTFAYNQPLHS